MDSNLRYQHLSFDARMNDPRHASNIAGNYYWRVLKDIDVFARVGHSRSNTYYGASMVLGVVYAPLSLQAGDEIHALCGGTFAVLKQSTAIAALPARRVYEIRLRLSDKSPFEKTYGGSTETWPLDRFEEIDRAHAFAVPTYHVDLPRLKAGDLYGRNIDSIVTAKAEPEEKER